MLRSAFGCSIPALLLAIAFASCDDAVSTDTLSHSVTLQTHFDDCGRADVEFSPSGKLLAAVTHEGVTVLNSASGDTLLAYKWPIAPGDITGQGCAFSEDGSLVAACLNEAVVVLNISAGSPLFYREYSDGPPSMIGAIAFVPGQPNSHLLLGGQMPRAYVLNFRTGVLISSTLIGHSVTAINVLPSGDMAAISLLGGTGDPILLWDFAHDKLGDVAPDCESFSTCLASSEDYSVAGCGGHSMLVWDQKLASYYGAIDGGYWAQAFSVSYHTSMLVTSTYVPRKTSSTSTIVLIDLDTLVPVYSWEAHTTAGLFDTAFSNDGTLIATAGYDGVVNIWSHQTP